MNNANQKENERHIESRSSDSDDSSSTSKSRKRHGFSNSSPTKQNGELNCQNSSPNECDVKNVIKQHNDAFGRSSQKIDLISFPNFNDLVQRNPDEILRSLLDEYSGFLANMGESEIGHESLAYLFIALGKACSADTDEEIFDLIKIIYRNRNSILIIIQKYLIRLQKKEYCSKNAVEKHYCDSLYYIAVILQKFQLILPSSSSDFISMLMPLLQTTKGKCLKTDEASYIIVEQKINEVDEQSRFYLENRELREIERESKNEISCLFEPLENFCSIPVLPTKDDIHLPCSYLRPNIVKGKYKNTEHYLDVQFRLLREDYIKPLRDGISEYLALKKLGKSVRNCRSVRVYNNATIVGEDFLNGHLLHFMHFSEKYFHGIKWDSSKRLLTGSLLCLSSDDFKETMLFATVVNRNPQELKRGYLCVQFQEIYETVLKLDDSINFVVVETTAYFEAYRHNLSALQHLDGKILPFKKYIVDVEKTVSEPAYLSPSTTFDLRPLMIPLDKQCISHGGVNKYIYPTGMSDVARRVTVLDESKWPSASALNLDNSQYIALKTAITKEFAIIQGPPGTGKTYIGLRAVQVLLHNRKQFIVDKSEPILIVCFTNHALDQFLEGLLLFTKKIVRIGGRGKNEAISKFQLKYLKKKSSFRNKHVPAHLKSAMVRQREQLKLLKTKINDLNNLIENSIRTVLNELELKEFIPLLQYHSLKYGYFDQGCGQHFESTIYDWLGINLQVMETISVKQHVVHSKNLFAVSNDELDYVQSEDEGDIEYIENERNIDVYDFEDMPMQFYNRKWEEFVDSKNSDWQTQESNEYHKKMRNHIKDRLKQSEAMKEDIALKINNIWMLDIDKRWQLYKYWEQKYVDELKQKLFALQEELKERFDKMAEMEAEEDLHILHTADIVGVTTTGAAKYRHLIQKLNPRILVVEEAAEILESHIVTSLAPRTQHLILIGDQQQLRPIPCVYKLAKEYNMDVSLFERMIKNDINYCKLSVQHRMRPDIAALISPHIYSNLVNHKIVTEFEDIKGVKKNVFFISHNIYEKQERDSKSKVNEHEARFLLKLCDYLLYQGYDPSQITILATYSGQLFNLKKIASENQSRFKEVRMTVVDNYQGEENDIILLSFVRSNKDGKIGFLKVPNRICVALSRAKKGLYCIGNFDLLAEQSSLWESIISTLAQKQSIGPFLELCCQNHPDTAVAVRTEADFACISDGGCTRDCEYRLQCGHVCPLRCHPYDHDSVRCEKPCIRTCPEGHSCTKKCFEFYGICRVLVKRTLSRCGHTIEVYCGIDDEDDFYPDFTCNFNCEKILRCNHRCVNKCSDPCVRKCRERCNRICKNGHRCKKQCFDYCDLCDVPVEVTRKQCGHTIVVDCGKAESDVKCTFDCKNLLPCLHNCTNKCGEPCVKKCVQLKNIQSLVCNHTVNVPCFLADNTGELLYSKIDFMNCAELCQEVLPCGHVCKGTCGSCSQGRLHIACNEPCRRTLICGHKCSSICSRGCPPCQKPCESKCVHATCPRKCFEPCVKCTRPCEWSCSHKKCTRLCGEICDRDPCNEPCSKILPCSHLCTGFCGEPCPVKCIICDDKKEPDSLSSQNVQNDNRARYILLEDCNHEFELQSIDEKMTVRLEENSEIELKACPICKTVIRRNMRYGNVLKTCLFQIEKIKRITRCNKENSYEIQEDLVDRLNYSWRLRDAILYQGSTYRTLTNILSSNKVRDISELITMENMINIISDYVCLERLKLFQKKFISGSPKLLSDYTRTTFRLINYILKCFTFASEYQLVQISLEFHRFRLISQLLEYACMFNLSCTSPEFDACTNYLVNYKPMSISAIKEFTSTFHDLSLKYGSHYKFDRLKEVPLLKGMNISTGHWYQCPEGHIYCLVPYPEVAQKECYDCVEFSKISPYRYFTVGMIHRPLRETSSAEPSTCSSRLRREYARRSPLFKRKQHVSLSQQKFRNQQRSTLPFRSRNILRP